MKTVTQGVVDKIIDETGCEAHTATNWAHKEALRDQVFNAKTFDDIKCVLFSIIRKADFSKAGVEI